MLHALRETHSSRRRVLTATLGCAATLAAALLAGQEGRAQSQLDAVRAQQEEIRELLAEENAAVDAALARAGELRAREVEVNQELAAKEAELASAQELLAEQRAALAQTEDRLRAAEGELGRFLVFVYKNGTIDEVQILLDADGMDDLAVRADYLGRINDYQADIVERVDRLREATAEKVGSTEDTVARIDASRDAIEAQRDQLAAASAAAEERKAELLAVKDERRDALARLLGREERLVDILSTPTDSSSPAPIANGPKATVNSDGTASAPADAPAAVKAAIAAGNQITNTPYQWGGGHGSFESSGYDCSGSVSFVLHGGGFLDSPLDSTGLMTWGDAGPGSWISVYSNPGHAFMVVAGLRFDTSGAPPRWQAAPRDTAGFVVRHPSGF